MRLKKKFTFKLVSQIIFFFIVFINLYANEVKIVAKIENDIITNIDIEQVDKEPVVKKEVSEENTSTNNTTTVDTTLITEETNIVEDSKVEDSKVEDKKDPISEILNSTSKIFVFLPCHFKRFNLI